jgi:hypothetical protein
MAPIFSGYEAQGNELLDNSLGLRSSGARPFSQNMQQRERSRL